MSNQTILVPIAVHAFSAHSSQLQDAPYQFAPLIPLQYGDLQPHTPYDPHLVQPWIDVSSARMSLQGNTRFYDIIKKEVKQERMGIYLSWILPPMYRRGIVADPQHSQIILDRGFPAVETAANDPKSRPAPNRWLVIRVRYPCFKWTDQQKSSVDVPFYLPQFFVVESDKLRYLEDADIAKIPDLDNMVSSFLDSMLPPGQQLPPDEQGRVRIGYQGKLRDWVSSQNINSPPMTFNLLNTPDAYFADYQPHHAGVFSIFDDLTADEEYDRFIIALQASGNFDDAQLASIHDELRGPKASAVLKYGVFGWHDNAQDDPITPFGAEHPSNRDRLAALGLGLDPCPIFPGKGPASPDAFLQSKVDSSNRTLLVGTTDRIFHGYKRGKGIIDTRETISLLNSLSGNILGVVAGQPWEPYFYSGVDPGKYLPTDAKPSLGDWIAAQEGLFQVATDFASGEHPEIEWDDMPHLPFRNYEIPSIDCQEQFSKSSPVVIGASSLDALLAYIRTLHAATDPADPYRAHRVWEQIPLVIRARSDDLDKRMEALQELLADDWISTQAGVTWVLGPKDAIKATSDTWESLQITYLVKDLDRAQGRANELGRRGASLLEQLYWSVWTMLATHGRTQDAEVMDQQWKIVKLNYDSYYKLLSFVRDVDSEIKMYTDKLHSMGVDFKTVADQPFLQHRDPTILLAGVDSQWPVGFDGTNTPVRLLSQLNPLQIASVDFDALDAHARDHKDSLSDRIDVIKTIFCDETLWARTELYDTPEQLNESIKQHGPLAYKMVNSFGQQGWFPLFVEYELNYYHIPLVTSTNGRYCWTLKNHEGFWMYSVVDDLQSIIKHHPLDVRILRGRMPILPQAGQALLASLMTLLNSAPHLLSEEQRAKLVEDVKRLKFLSCQLSGFNDHLLTLLGYPHTTKKIFEMVQTKILGTNASDDQMRLLKDVTAACSGSIPNSRIPYAFSDALDDSSPEPFKPATHGQVLFTKLSIVDKFGQIVNCVPPAGALYPTLSPSFACDHIANTSTPQPITVKTPDGNKDGQCQFFQICPRINQPARLNVKWMSDYGDTVLADPSAGNPILGWVVTSYTDDSLQFFTGDGHFYCEISILDEDKSVDVQRYEDLPFDTGTLPRPSKTLLAWVEPMLYGDTPNPWKYASQLYTTLIDYTSRAASSARDHKDIVPSAIGKAFALVNVGYGLELSSSPLSDTTGRTDSTTAVGITDYTFPLQLGTGAAANDGWVAFRKLQTNSSTVHKPYTPEDGPQRRRTRSLFRSNQVKDRRYLSRKNITGTSDVVIAVSAKDLIGSDAQFTISPYWPETGDEHVEQLGSNAFTGLVDPFVPLHAYTAGVLPAQAITVPDEAIRSAAKGMWTFLNMGPLLLPKSHKTLSQPVQQGGIEHRQPATTEDSLRLLQADPTLGTVILPVLQISPKTPQSATSTDPTASASDVQVEWRRYEAFGFDQSTNLDSSVTTMVEGILEVGRKKKDQQESYWS